MLGFDVLYKQTITLFNRVKGQYGEEVLWYPTVIDNVHLIVDKSHSWNSYGGNAVDNARLHIRYTPSGDDVLILCRDSGGKTQRKKWYEPKAWRHLEKQEDGITFAYGDSEVFDFFVEGAFDDFSIPISDDAFERKGFYNWMNSHHDNVFAVTSVSKYNLIPHFVIMAR